MENKKVHFKMYKAGKKWLFAGIATSMMAGAFFFTSNTASADVISSGQQHVGTSYVWGGSNPGGFDCSGFTQYVFAQNGISLPRTAAAQYAASQPISASEARPGDLVFISNGGIYHVGIYQGNGMMLDAQNRGVISGDSISYFPGQVLYGRVGGGASAAANAQTQATVQQPAANTNQTTNNQAADNGQATDNSQANQQPAANNDQAAAQPATDNSQADQQPAANNDQAAAQPATDNSQANQQPAANNDQAAAQPATDNSQADQQPAANNDQAVAQPAADNSQANQQPAASNDQAAAQPAVASAKPEFTDAKLVSQSSAKEGQFNVEKGYFTNGDTKIAVRTSADLKAKVKGYLPANAQISYDGYVVKDGHVWVEYTGFSGNKLYCPVRETNKVAWGSFE
ncbi:NlpC/P60 family protein [Fructilactobacillus myrtifloralis]|uniref:NlpC/P60 family protein n=1 Tax=Fructilactobacillus myrtifloralis TaxID=2940301 RepID=A0ABY5BNG2_9LACO|nr:NlpC/P60 family protein [Fructilactobacillus myrtifloralis]USS85100.1 NlpC/P60 family protein [Fructilactobacillus myrtifloralis]